MTDEQQTSLVEFLGRAEDRFENAPMGMLFESEKSYAVQILEANEFTKGVALKAPGSLLSAMSNVASIGLSLNPAKKQAYLVPRKGKICLDPSYMGMCDLAIQSGAIKLVQAKVVYSEDTYINKGVDKKPKHQFEAFGDRGDMVGVYCTAKTADGDYLTTEMKKSEIDDIKGRSELGKKNKGPWVTDYNEMAKKTVVRQSFKMWPKTPTLERLAMAIELSNQNEEFEQILTSPELSQYSEEQKKHFDYLIQSNDGMGMFCFIESITEGDYISLYNSFKQGEKGKYKSVVDSLQESGRAQLGDCRAVIEEAARNGDELGVKELTEDLSKEAVDYILDNTDDETRQFVQSLGESE